MSEWDEYPGGYEQFQTDRPADDYSDYEPEDDPLVDLAQIGGAIRSWEAKDKFEYRQRSNAVEAVVRAAAQIRAAELGEKAPGSGDVTSNSIRQASLNWMKDQGAQDDPIVKNLRSALEDGTPVGSPAATERAASIREFLDRTLGKENRK